MSLRHNPRQPALRLGERRRLAIELGTLIDAIDAIAFHAMNLNHAKKED